MLAILCFYCKNSSDAEQRMKKIFHKIMKSKMIDNSAISLLRSKIEKPEQKKYVLEIYELPRHAGSAPNGFWIFTHWSYFPTFEKSLKGPFRRNSAKIHNTQSLVLQTAKREWKCTFRRFIEYNSQAIDAQRENENEKGVDGLLVISFICREFVLIM